MTAPAHTDALPHPQVDPAVGHYLHPQTPVTTVSTVRHGSGGLVETVSAQYVAVADYLALQKERDDLRRALALINAWRLMPGRDESRLARLLASAGQTAEVGEAIVGIVASLSDAAADTATGTNHSD